MLDVLRLIPKLNVRLMAACRAKNTRADFHRTAAGYSHTYFDANGIPIGLLSEFPSDHDIARAARSAFNEASALWELLGCCHSSRPMTCAAPPSASTQNVIKELEDDDVGCDHNADNAAFQNCDRRILQEALNTSQHALQLDAGAHAQLDECVYAAACLNVADRETM
jgi:hypothetical protein